MIGYLRGTVRAEGKNFIVLDVGGVGYKVYASEQTIAQSGGQETELWIYTAVREDALDLFGFADRDTLAFFELLLGVPGIGPRTALSILSLADVRTLRSAVASGDTTYLTKVSGVGKKTAEKIVLELDGKLGPVSAEDALPETAGEMDALEALKALGYDERHAREALKKVPKDVADIGERVKAAMRHLGGK